MRRILFICFLLLSTQVHGQSNTRAVLNSKESFKRNTLVYGQGDNACVLKISNTDNDANILGGDDSVLGSYYDRDKVLVYKSFQSQPSPVFHAEVFTTKSVRVNEDLSGIEIKPGMYVDCYLDEDVYSGNRERKYNPADKYSGFVSRIEGNTIFVNNWYYTGNTQPTVPQISYSAIVINGETKIWLENGVLTLREDANAKFANVAEYDLYNGKSKIDANARCNGIEIASQYGKSEYAFRAKRNIRNTDYLRYGFYSEAATNGFTAVGHKNQICNIGFLSEGPYTNNGFVSLNAINSSFLAGGSITEPQKINYWRDGSGKLKINKRAHHTCNESQIFDLNSSEASSDSWIFKGENLTITLPVIKDKALIASLEGRVFEFFCMNSVIFVCENPFFMPKCPKKGGKVFVSDTMKKYEVLFIDGKWVFFE